MPMINPKAKKKTAKRKRVEFHTATANGPFVRLDAKAGKTKVAGLADEDLMTGKPVTVHLDLADAETGWIDFSAGEGFIGNDFDEKPASAGKSNGAKWGFGTPIAAPYPFEIDGTEVESVPQHELRITAAAVISAMEELYGEWEEAVDNNDGDEAIAIVTVDGWEKKEGGRNAVFRPRFKLEGLAADLETPDPGFAESQGLPFDK